MHNGRIYMVGFQHIYEGFILSWADRIDEQVKKKAWFEAGMFLDHIQYAFFRLSLPR